MATYSGAETSRTFYVPLTVGLTAAVNTPQTPTGIYTIPDGREASVLAAYMYIAAAPSNALEINIRYQKDLPFPISTSSIAPEGIFGIYTDSTIDLKLITKRIVLGVSYQAAYAGGISGIQREQLRCQFVNNFPAAFTARVIFLIKETFSL